MTAVAIILGNTSPIKPIVIDAAEDTGDFCACDFRCDFEETVFSNSLGDGVSNDFSDFLFRKISPSDTVVIKLFRYDVLVATITDNTYGTYYSTFTEKPLYVGWIADWTLIFNAFTGGRYQVKVTSTILGQNVEFESRYFRLVKFDPEIADRTVKIESFQNGNIESSQFDFTNLVEGGWPSSIRLRGEFGKMQPTLEQDIYKDSSYRVTQIRDFIDKEYNLNCEIIPETIYTQIASKDILGNSILISSFNLLQDEKYLRFPVTADSFDTAEYKGYGRLNFNIKFKDRQQNNIKRNF